ncbi:MAG: hypothetical protein RI554_09895 [Trueperaceae bacterium]|nr:hypothetical protein [Trueperaceae bacterium]
MNRNGLANGKRGTRSFQLTVHPEREGFAVALLETSAQDRTTDVVAKATKRRTSELTGALQRALTKSGHARTVLTPRRKKPIPIHEDEGVRLALAMLATEPVRKGRRKTTLLTAVDTMATEEAYYWYAKCVGQDRPRAQRALRLLLAEE